MSFNKSVICLGLSVLAFSSVSMASDFGKSTGTVDFTGTIVNTPCSITAANQNLKVDLGNVPVADFTATAGTLGGSQKQFTIVLSNCTVIDDPYTAKVTFSGYMANDKKSLGTDAGQDTSGQPVATGVGIQISEGSSKTPLALGVEGAAVPITQPEMHLNYAAQYISTAATVSPGLANGHADFTVSYE